MLVLLFDAATRGLTVALVEKHDLAFSAPAAGAQLVHGGLRHSASGTWASPGAAPSKVESMTRNAPHLVHAMPQLVPLLPSMGHTKAGAGACRFLAGDARVRRRRRCPRSRRNPGARHGW